jgi:hypothetical protein
MKYESPITYHSKDMVNVKVFEDRPTNRRTCQKIYALDLSIKGLKNSESKNSKTLEKISLQMRQELIQYKVHVAAVYSKHVGKMTCKLKQKCWNTSKKSHARLQCVHNNRAKCESQPQRARGVHYTK